MPVSFVRVKELGVSGMTKFLCLTLLIENLQQGYLLPLLVYRFFRVLFILYYILVYICMQCCIGIFYLITNVAYVLFLITNLVNTGDSLYIFFSICQIQYFLVGKKNKYSLLNIFQTLFQQSFSSFIQTALILQLNLVLPISAAGLNADNLLSALSLAADV